MAIEITEIKKLWGRAAGRCSFSSCGVDCIPFITDDINIIIGEMAHIIARRSDGPRGNVNCIDDNSYENLILLCPTHHTQVDKAPEVYTEDCLLEMKHSHEHHIEEIFCRSTIKFHNIHDVAKAIQRILMENKRVWENYGPESEEARQNPNSNLVNFWMLRKLDTIVPNNHRIINIIETNKDLFDEHFYNASIDFAEHARGFERNCYERTDGIKRFPANFEEEVNKHVER